MEKNYLDINRKAWDAKVEPHLQSEFYAVKDFINGKNALRSIELELLGDIAGKTILHLQCHFGQDSISLARAGAMVTGVDFSEKALEAAQDLAQKCEQNVRFICSDLYDLPNHLDEKFDIIFTSYGTVGWLPDLEKWAGVISHFLKPNGNFVMADFHPFVWMYDDYFTKIEYSYFNTEDIIELVDGTYAKKDAAISTETVSWNHPISEILQSLIKAGLVIEVFQEFDYSPYPCFNGIKEDEPEKWRIENFGKKVPMVYAIKAKKSS